MDSADQVILVLQIALVLGPISLYFLGLGLVNSLARPCLVSARADFLILTLAFVPVIVLPLVSLTKLAGYEASSLVALVMLGLFFWLLPSASGGWVIYNVSPAQHRRILQQACRRLGWRSERAPGTLLSDDLQVEPVGLELRLNYLPWLRNVTLRIEQSEGVTPATEPGAAPDRRFIRCLADELQKEQSLPSAAGAGLVVIGATLLGLPMWYLFHHMNAVVDVVRQIFPA